MRGRVDAEPTWKVVGSRPMSAARASASSPQMRRLPAAPPAPPCTPATSSSNTMAVRPTVWHGVQGSQGENKSGWR